MSHRLMSHRKPEAVQFFHYVFIPKRLCSGRMFYYFSLKRCVLIFFSKHLFLHSFFFPYTTDSFKYLFAYNIASIIKDTSIKHYIQTINYF